MRSSLSLTIAHSSLPLECTFPSSQLVLGDKVSTAVWWSPHQVDFHFWRGSPWTYFTCTQSNVISHSHPVSTATVSPHLCLRRYGMHYICHYMEANQNQHTWQPTVYIALDSRVKVGHLKSSESRTFDTWFCDSVPRPFSSEVWWNSNSRGRTTMWD